MTRINCVPPAELCRQHLIAEYRELPRIFTLAKRMAERGEMPPPADGPYILGTGHMKSFCGRIEWLIWRHGALVAEMVKRNYVPAFKDVPDFVCQIPERYWGWYRPTESDMALCRARLMFPNNHKCDGAAIQCPHCTSRRTAVYATWHHNGITIRRRKCLKCQRNFKTAEELIKEKENIK